MTQPSRTSELDGLQSIPERVIFLLNPISPSTSYRHNGIRLESRWSHVRFSYAPKCSACPEIPADPMVDFYSYNRYLTVAARAVRRSLKDGPRAAAERRGNMDLRFAKWEVRI